jgi:hypothetical protein
MGWVSSTGSRAHSSAGERPLHTREVPGSIPGAPIRSLEVLRSAHSSVSQTCQTCRRGHGVRAPMRTRDVAEHGDAQCGYRISSRIQKAGISLTSGLHAVSAYNCARIGGITRPHLVEILAGACRGSRRRSHPGRRCRGRLAAVLRQAGAASWWASAPQLRPPRRSRRPCASARPRSRAGANSTRGCSFADRNEFVADLEHGAVEPRPVRLGRMPRMRPARFAPYPAELQRVELLRRAACLSGYALPAPAALPIRDATLSPSQLIY